MKSSFKFLKGTPKRLHYNAPYISLQNNINQPNRYDMMVARHVSNCMRSMIWWRGYETWVDETNGYARLKIVSGINIDGMFHIVYLITRNGNTENYRVSVRLTDLERG